ncbi:Hypothetical protein D9617_72g012000 [Elsinoe fawcettii]|nr:Hypothetical protein D9617_72g012000 [Elsinoe fawcettii]
MARNAAPAQRDRAVQLILTNLFTNQQIATASDVSVRAVQQYKANLRLFGAAEAPHVVRGPLRLLQPRALSALLQVLIHKPSMFLDEMAVFLYDQFGIQASLTTVHRALDSVG